MFAVIRLLSHSRSRFCMVSRPRSDVVEGSNFFFSSMLICYWTRCFEMTLSLLLFLNVTLIMSIGRSRNLYWRDSKGCLYFPCGPKLIYSKFSLRKFYLLNSTFYIPFPVLDLHMIALIHYILCVWIFVVTVRHLLCHRNLNHGD